ncbi:MAG: type II toxin-antitoxin system RelE/ParE family toxin [Methanobacteriota archaeon]
MLTIDHKKDFLKKVEKIKNKTFKEKVKKQIEKIIDDPETGKLMRYARKGTREVYVKPYRLAYAYEKSENKIIFLEIYHKDEQ